MEHLIKISDRIVERKPDLIKLSRSEKRKKGLLIQWFDKNQESIEDLVTQIVPVDEFGNVLDSFDPKKFLWKFRDEIEYYFPDEFFFDFSDFYYS